ncbi:MAG: nucleotidyltransferase [Candidatus Helarchaeota archaeon]
MTKFEEIILHINEVLKRMKVNFVFSGAIAANVYRTIPRGTMDIDVAIPFNKEVLNKIKAAFKDSEFENWDIAQKRLEIKNKYPDIIIPEFLRLKHPSGYEIDFLPLYSDFLTHKRKAKLMNFEINVISPEDLILLKSIFYRPKDQDDIINILENSKLKLNIEYLIKELKDYEKNNVIKLIRRIKKEKKS